MIPEQKFHIIRLLGVAALILAHAAVECTKTYVSYITDEEAETVHRAASRKRARGSPLTGNDRHKVRRMSAAQAFSDLMNTLRNAMDTLTAAIREVAATPALETSMLSIAISIVAKEADFSQYDMDDTLDIFMDNPRAAETYAAITDASARTRFLRRRLDEFRKDKMDGIRKD